MDRDLWRFGARQHVRTVLLVFLFIASTPVAALHAQSDLPPALENAGADEPKPGTAGREAGGDELGAVAADTDPTKPEPGTDEAIEVPEEPAVPTANVVLDGKALMYRRALEVGNRVQIITPAYREDPTQPKVVPREQWHAAPVKPG